MKRMILGTMMCVLMAAGVVAQEQDSIVKRDLRHEGMHPRREVRGDVHREMRGEMRDGRAEFRDGKRAEHVRPDIRKDAGREKMTPEQRAEAKAKFLTEKLTLTKKQSEKLQKVFLKEAETFEKQKAELEGKDEAAKREQMKNLKANTDKQVKKILTDEEYAKYLELGKCPKGEGGCKGEGKFEKGEGKCEKGKIEGGHRPKPHILPKQHENHPDKRVEVEAES